ncbi:hypothetical protein C4D60_Mb01t07500 [Musa balbisiana]|uniref:Fumarylacetoacetase-like C-terminal domain-containing protein n=1 Tax=Musa balbisiana TaxID=52838 RepID=A0A4S8JKI6_MUSBA|nr:hypothetical protein C4D60_Mb01t07500 [Musa balbisiana]
MAAATASRLLSAGTKIIAVGRNYAAHAKELGNAVPKVPVLFMKPTSSYLQNGGTIEVPHPLESLDHEVELAVVIGKKARDVTEASAMDYVGGYALALDMTAREIQSAAKSAGLPWTVAKGQDTFTPISAVLPRSMVVDPNNLELWLKIIGKSKKAEAGGTPSGVGPVKIGQKITAGITGLIDVHYDVQRRQKPLNV